MFRFFLMLLIVMSVSVGCVGKQIQLLELKMMRTDGTTLEIGELSLTNVETVDLFNLLDCPQKE